MTYDELLDLINTPRFLASPLADNIRNAARAVLELHKPTDWHPGCAQCGYYEWPCPSIQAIEKELK